MQKMRDDQDFNIQFVQIIKRERSLYDKTLPEYRSKDEHDKIWQKVADEVNESVGHCKERWRNLRACLTRHLKQSKKLSETSPSHKPYYLAEHMSFLLPFTKCRSPKDPLYVTFESEETITGEVTTTPNKILKKEDGSTSMNDHQSSIVADVSLLPVSINFSNQPTSFTTIPISTATILNTTSENHEIATLYTSETGGVETSSSTPMLTRSSNTYAGIKRKNVTSVVVPPQKLRSDVSVDDQRPLCSTAAAASSEIPIDAKEIEDADLSFFKSLLPDIRNLSAKQKRKFKIGVFELINDITDNNE